jgi:hypothetical protein
MHSSNSLISNMSKHVPSPSFPWLVLSLDYPKPYVVAYENIMPYPLSLYGFQDFCIFP